jgi:RNA polymerase sigma-70 factor, ECF subfamily
VKTPFIAAVPTMPLLVAAASSGAVLLQGESGHVGARQGAESLVRPHSVEEEWTQISLHHGQKRTCRTNDGAAPQPKIGTSRSGMSQTPSFVQLCRMNDAEQLRLAVADESAFEAVYRRHAPRLFRWLTRETSREEALDLVAETFAQMLISIDGFRGRDDAEATAWLNGIARNLLRDYLRGRSVLARALRRLEIEEAVAGALGRAAEEYSRDLDALGQLVDEAFDELTLSEQEALRLRVLEEMAYEDVARLLEIDPQAARMRVSRALRTLRIRIQEER